MLHAINHMKGSSHIKLCEVVAPYVAHCLRVLNGCIYVRSYSPSSWTNDHALTLHHQAPFGANLSNLQATRAIHVVARCHGRHPRSLPSGTGLGGSKFQTKYYSIYLAKYNFQLHIDRFQIISASLYLAPHGKITLPYDGRRVIITRSRHGALPLTVYFLAIVCTASLKPASYLVWFCLCNS